MNRHKIVLYLCLGDDVLMLMSGKADISDLAKHIR